MTEYNASPEAIQEFMTSKERTAYWVSSHEPSQFDSPSVPPSVLDDPDSQLYEPSESDAESTHSLPPRMVLKYGDGRPDIPISHWHYDPRQTPQRHGTASAHGRAGQQNSIHNRSKSGSHIDNIPSRHGTMHVPSRHTGQASIYNAPRSPEEIRILPSETRETPRSIHPSAQQSRSQSRNSRSPEDGSPSALYPPSHHTQPPPTAPSSSSYVFVPSAVSPSAMAYSHSQPIPSHPYPGMPQNRSGSRSPPAIVYAPAHHSRTHYTPPAMMYSHNPPAMKYSQSDPHPQSKYTPYPPGATPYHSANGAPHLSSVDEEMRLERSRGRSRGASRSVKPGQRDGSRPPSRGLSASDSQDSGSTYYIIPTPGQKVQIIVPEGARSVYTATSTTKSPSSPQSGSMKRPFFQRLFSLASVDSKGSVGKRLQRRHSTGTSSRRAVSR